MKLPTILSSAALVAIAAAQAPFNESATYSLRTSVKPGQTGKEAYHGLWLGNEHTTPGIADVILLQDGPDIKGWLNPVVPGTDHGDDNNYQNFDLGTASTPWTLLIATNADLHADWQPVRIVAGNGRNVTLANSQGIARGFFLNETGLQWAAADGGPRVVEFGGWLGMCFVTRCSYPVAVSELTVRSMRLVAHTPPALLAHNAARSPFSHLYAFELRGCGAYSRVLVVKLGGGATGLMVMGGQRTVEARCASTRAATMHPYEAPYERAQVLQCIKRI
ncbi:hypothetical protein LTR62_006036 [Meristemomyces frigidus]|uniref:DUF7907 domain-containing protein n=1 Tax=Meristemomyces frigidus TaxID=1508187 RepID=A0AAN7TN35_9PEZI|nr:hypothetical protein LTR62_006036 [Meristemomyces frigidus]